MVVKQQKIVRKTLDRREWFTDEERTFLAMPYKDEYFEGVMGLITFAGLKKPEVLNTMTGKLCIADNGYRWLQLVPRGKHWVMTAMFDAEGKLFQCYYDVTRKNELPQENELRQGNVQPQGDEGIQEDEQPQKAECRTVFYDMFLDVVVPGEGAPMILDRDELDEALQQGIITEDEYDTAVETAERIVGEYAEHRDRIRRWLEERMEIMKNIRQAAPKDVSRISEIIITNYRVNFYPFFHNDKFYFGELNVMDMAAELCADPDKLKSYYVYDDGVIKGVACIVGELLDKLYVEPQFQNNGIGKKLLDFAVHGKGAKELWALEYNIRGISFYQRNGFQLTGEKMIEDEWVPLLKMEVV